MLKKTVTALSVAALAGTSALSVLPAAKASPEGGQMAMMQCKAKCGGCKAKCGAKCGAHEMKCGAKCGAKEGEHAMKCGAKCKAKKCGCKPK